MKHKIFKGNPGYFKSRKKSLLIASLAGILLVLLFFVTGYVINGTPKNYFSIVAVLAVLPTAKVYVQYAMLPWKMNADIDYYNKLCETYPDMKIAAELLITGSEKRFEITYLAIDKDENIVAYTMNPKCNPALFEKAVVNFLNYYNYDAKVKLCNDLKAFEKKLKLISTNRSEITEEQREHILTVFEKVSIMSI